jgi:hypothetical protein
MDFLAFLTSLPFREVSSTVILVGVVALILTGRLVTRRQLTDAYSERDAWKLAHSVSEEARAQLNTENFKLLETSRISDQFYRDFLPAVSKANNHKAGEI